MNLNKACPKDSFPLPWITQLVNTTAGQELLSFMDTYSGYNQILMYQLDKEHTSFITHWGLYCYKAMPFGLKNTGATYQKLVNGMFRDLIGKSVEVYVDDMLVKSKTVGDHIEHLNQMFNILQKYQMKLNPLKCAFRVNQHWIEANLEKISALLEMSSWCESSSWSPSSRSVQLEYWIFIDVFQGQDYEGSNRIELEAFRGELLEIWDFQLTDPESVDWFWVSCYFLVSFQTVLNCIFSYFGFSNYILAYLFNLFLILKTLDEFNLLFGQVYPF